MIKTGVPVYFAVGLEVTNIRSPSILFHKTWIHYRRFMPLLNSETVDGGRRKKWIWAEKAQRVAQIQGKELWKCYWQNFMNFSQIFQIPGLKIHSKRWVNFWSKCIWYSDFLIHLWFSLGWIYLKKVRF